MDGGSSPRPSDDLGHIIWGPLELSDLDGDHASNSGAETVSSSEQERIEQMKKIVERAQFRPTRAKASSSSADGPRDTRAQASMRGSRSQEEDGPRGEGARVAHTSGSGSHEEVAPATGAADAGPYTRHDTGECRPCAFYWRTPGCIKGAQCDFCHRCPRGEFIARRKQKIARLRAEQRARRGDDANNARP
mmetsp:Transcript_121019/g.353635  ORF Transcript_121019/g.353635 Transcript_121019/m.353635 type:complete len:191 (-) Transcript_121019:141-713(-)